MRKRAGMPYVSLEKRGGIAYIRVMAGVTGGHRLAASGTALLHDKVELHATILRCINEARFGAISPENQADGNS